LRRFAFIHETYVSFRKFDVLLNHMSTSSVNTTVTVVNNGPELGTTVSMRKHELQADEPVELKGQDTGPAPDELLLASLGACTAITLRMYMRHKGYDFATISVDLSLSVDKSQGHSTHIERRIHIPDCTDEALLARFQQVAEACPISKILHNPIALSTFVNKP
jgi:putative redox protein